MIACWHKLMLTAPPAKPCHCREKHKNRHPPVRSLWSLPQFYWRGKYPQCTTWCFCTESTSQWCSDPLFQQPAGYFRISLAGTSRANERWRISYPQSKWTIMFFFWWNWFENLSCFVCSLAGKRIATTFQPGLNAEPSNSDDKRGVVSYGYMSSGRTCHRSSSKAPDTTWRQTE